MHLETLKTTYVVRIDKEYAALLLYNMACGMDMMYELQAIDGVSYFPQYLGLNTIRVEIEKLDDTPNLHNEIVRTIERHRKKWYY